MKKLWQTIQYSQNNKILTGYFKQNRIGYTRDKIKNNSKLVKRKGIYIHIYTHIYYNSQQ